MSHMYIVFPLDALKYVVDTHKRIGILLLQRYESLPR